MTKTSAGMELIPAHNTNIAPVAVPLHTVQAVERMAQVAVESRLFGEIKTEAQAFALMLLCQAKGLHPMAAMERYHVINNRPTMKADAMLAEFQSANGQVQWEERTDQRAAATFYHPSGGRVTITWDMARANKAGLTNKDTWRKHPGQMLAARVVSEGVRAVLPGVIIGIYTPDEARNMDPIEPLEPMPQAAYTPAAVEPIAPPEPVPAQLDPRLELMRAFAAEADRLKLTHRVNEGDKRNRSMVMDLMREVLDVPSDTVLTAEMMGEATTLLSPWAAKQPVSVPASVGELDEDPFADE